MSSDNNTGCRLLAGVWTRLWEEDPLGDTANADTTTRVWWIQTPSGIYVDLRLPRNSPGLLLLDNNQEEPDPSALSGTGFLSHYNVSPAVTPAVLQQKSFAGVLQVSLADTTDGSPLGKDTILAALVNDNNDNNNGNNDDSSPSLGSNRIPLCTCFWRRDVDYQPPTCSLDIGVCVMADITNTYVDLRETGQDASYAEGWRRFHETAQGTFMALRLLHENNTPRTGYWVRAGDQFAYAVGRPTCEATATALGCCRNTDKIQQHKGSLEEVTRKLVLQDTKNVEQQQLALAWSHVGVVGSITRNNVQDDGECWQITASLDPRLVGCALFDTTTRNSSLVCSTVAIEPNRPGTPQRRVVQTLLADNSCRIRVWEVVECQGCELPGGAAAAK